MGKKSSFDALLPTYSEFIFGHVTRRDPESLEKLFVTGRVEGTRSQGRCPTRLTDKVRALTGLTINEAQRQERVEEVKRRH
ncbi:unnamed protein product [Pieris macdunnoughi]|uniref:Uncharacterized protein n=1 Tax=Pieris macdunnoughi TaxID=345717 RepID=A0A821W7B4_9NEOP|nr:unnamed protein product [Pieris macdunnoughi]